MNATVRQPSDNFGDDAGDNCGGSNSMSSPYCGPPSRTQQ
jgi:hypothetical protein